MLSMYRLRLCDMDETARQTGGVCVVRGACVHMACTWRTCFWADYPRAIDMRTWTPPTWFLRCQGSQVSAAEYQVGGHSTLPPALHVLLLRLDTRAALHVLLRLLDTRAGELPLALLPLALLPLALLPHRSLHRSHPPPRCHR